ncbi:YigZ family protein [Methylotenera sp.]|uniref:IMPACT family protein n=1 Tax=Methylotenera sp. TaxID=2051956 RepID=UPI00248A5904|nr:YigZ family protein [Methylotenera sp.]MDI1300016.1 YigZ family protein [Methylotenera sp.]
MLVITQAGFADQTINKSRFIAMALACADEREIGQALRAFASKHPTAHHLAYGFRLKTEQGIVPRFSDAGEPSGTAGMPVLKLIEGRNLINVCVAVIRYYGGINLGTGGLARAYGGTAKLALDAAKTSHFVEMKSYPLTITYKQMDMMINALLKCNGSIVSKAFNDQIELVVLLPVDESFNFLNRFKPYGG